MEAVSDPNPHRDLNVFMNLEISYCGCDMFGSFSFQVFYSGPFCLHGTFLHVAGWISCLLLVQSQASDNEPAVNSSRNHPGRTMRFGRRATPSRTEVYVTVLWSFVASSLPSVLTGDFAKVQLSRL